MSTAKRSKPRKSDTSDFQTMLTMMKTAAVAMTRVAEPPHSRAYILLESRARTIEQMRLINALCRFVEMAKS